MSEVSYRSSSRTFLSGPVFCLATELNKRHIDTNFENYEPWTTRRKCHHNGDLHVFVLLMLSFVKTSSTATMATDTTRYKFLWALDNAGQRSFGQRNKCGDALIIIMKNMGYGHVFQKDRQPLSIV